ncbi:hypothetical protein EUGRSUZ_A01560 [Eucalyptus grandis]|uniref:Uncharacterized protein n=2 Tax=Eucalyptus grandis TaxID=71139 RepID=A0ACC3M3L1_EUCGR|nr:hypothetical protein EUGRSUZ_A01560 [Eucalyptus grandis]
MQPIDDKEETVVIRAVSHDEEGKKKVEKTEVNTHNVDTLRYIEKKLMDKGVIRMERHPVDGIGIGRPPPKSGHGGKYTWEGPVSMVEAELEPVPPAIDERDPNYVDEEAEGRILRGEIALAKMAVEMKVLFLINVQSRTNRSNSKVSHRHFVKHWTFRVPVDQSASHNNGIIPVP